MSNSGTALIERDMKRLVLIVIACFSLCAQKAYAVSVCPNVFWEQVVNVCQSGEVNFGLRICPGDEANPNITFDHVEWNFGNGTVISNTSLSVTYNYTTGGTYNATAEVYFIVNGIPCSTIAKRITSYSLPGAPWQSYTEWITNTNYAVVDQCATPTPSLLENFVTVSISSLNVDLWVSTAAPYAPLQAVTINLDIANLGVGEVINYTLSVDNAAITTGTYSSNGLQTTAYTIPALVAGQTSATHVLELNGIDPKRPNCPIIRTVILEVETQQEPCDHCLTFRPDPNKRYWVSAWVKVIDPGTIPQSSIPQVISYDSGLDASTAGIQLEFIGSSPSTVYFRPSGDIIEGWQRIAGEFTTPNGATEVNIKLNNPVPDKVAYFDDVRIHPFNGSMKSYVNDPDTFWLTAELDDNNYATFYEYDMEGKLIRIKKETSKGIVTIKENRSSNPKTN